MRTALALLCSTLALAGCAKPKPLFVDQAWVRLAATPRGPAAAYFTVHGGPTDATLIAVSTDVAIKSEMHETMAAGGGMTGMKPLDHLAIPAHATVPFAPGGRHVMLWDVNPGIKPGARMTLTLSFANGDRLLQDATVVAPGAPAPK